ASDLAVEFQRSLDLAVFLQGPSDGESDSGAPGGLFGAAAELVRAALPLVARQGLLPSPPHEALRRALLLPLEARLHLACEHDTRRGRRRGGDQGFQERFDLGALPRGEREEPTCRRSTLPPMQGDRLLQVLRPTVVQVGAGIAVAPQGRGAPLPRTA